MMSFHVEKGNFNRDVEIFITFAQTLFNIPTQRATFLTYMN